MNKTASKRKATQKKAEEAKPAGKKPELRRLMRKEPRKVDSPLAKYMASGQLVCILCNSPVKSDLVWTAHVNGKVHRENLLMLKKSKSEAASVQNAPPEDMEMERDKSPTDLMPPPPKKQKMVQPGSLPNNFFDPTAKPKKSILRNRTDYKVETPSVAAMRSSSEGPEAMEEDDKDLVGQEEPEATVPSQDAPLPEGFFDDPVADARVRHVEYRDPGEEEWERFQREIKEASTVSARIVEEERAEASAERQLEEIDDQIRHWSRVIEVERRKEELRRAAAEAAAAAAAQEDSDSGEEADVDEFLDWRAKRA